MSLIPNYFTVLFHGVSFPAEVQYPQDFFIKIVSSYLFPSTPDSTNGYLDRGRFSSRDQRKDKENEENNKKYSGDPGSQPSDHPKPENPGNDRDHQKQESPR
jgi:hypothetical protein